MSPCAGFSCKLQTRRQCHCSSQRHWCCWTLCGGLAPRPLADQRHMAGFWSPVLAACPGSIKQPCLLGPGRTTVQCAARQAAIRLHRFWEFGGKCPRWLCYPSGDPVLGTHNLLLGSALSLIARLGLLIVTLRKYTAPLTTVAEEEPTAQSTAHSLAQLLKQRYVVVIFLIQMLLILVYYLVDFTFLAQTKAHYQTEAQLANFLGPFWAWLKRSTSSPERWSQVD